MTTSPAGGVLRFAVALVLLQGVGTARAIAGEILEVRISDLAYSPAEISAHVGDTVVWVNGDFIDHTATATNGDWDVTIAAGKSARMELSRPGEFAYYCRVHPGMTGTIRVAPQQ